MNPNDYLNWLEERQRYYKEKIRKLEEDDKKANHLICLTTGIGFGVCVLALLWILLSI